MTKGADEGRFEKPALVQWANKRLATGWRSTTLGADNATERENQLIEVRLKRNELVEKALRRLKKQMLREGVIKELRQRRYYEKPSVKGRLKMKAARFDAMLKQRHADD